MTSSLMVTELLMTSILFTQEWPVRGLGGDVLSDVLVAGLVGSLCVVSEGDNGPVVGGVELLFVDSAVARRRSEWLGGVGLVGDCHYCDISSGGFNANLCFIDDNQIVDLNNLVDPRWPVSGLVCVWAV
jgi:hypothetical protein